MIRFQNRHESNSTRLLRQVDEIVTLAREVCGECDKVLRAGIAPSNPVALWVSIETRQGHPWRGIPRVACSLHEVED